MSVTLKAHLQFLAPQQTRVVRVVSVAFGSWGVDGLPMHRSMANQELWGLTFQVPRGAQRLVYKYGAVDLAGGVWEEVGPGRSLSLQVVGPTMEVEDYVEHAAPRMPY